MFVLMNFSLATFMDPGVIPRGNKIQLVTLKALSFGIVVSEFRLLEVQYILFYK